MADLQFPLPHDHALDQQLQDLLLLRQRRPVQPGPDPLAERRQVRQHRPGARRLLAEPRLLLSLLGQGRPPLDDSPAAQAEFLQADDLRLVGVDQPPLLALQPLELGLQLLGLRPLARIRPRRRARAMSRNWASSASGSLSRAVGRGPRPRPPGVSASAIRCGHRCSRALQVQSLPLHR